MSVARATELFQINLKAQSLDINNNDIASYKVMSVTFILKDKVRLWTRLRVCGNEGQA